MAARPQSHTRSPPQLVRLWPLSFAAFFMVIGVLFIVLLHYGGSHAYFPLHCPPQTASCPQTVVASINTTHYIPHTTHYTPHIAHYTPHIAHHTPHITHHTSHITHHTSHITHYASYPRLANNNTQPVHHQFPPKCTPHTVLPRWTPSQVPKGVRPHLCAPCRGGRHGRA